ncbi:hypothetical protein STVIR_6058 [Streptomyces viridochromogenes Tue57]|uniref:Uncharacterized protein n=1 Tax=Streptomyces viridochromogenes Tue57 TaxID=1160705 RepID=L8P9Y0_STRVR|nr:hypothetical protein STVIR_6058 [Streptomyces viridochromogenes Tue57]
MEAAPPAQRGHAVARCAAEGRAVSSVSGERAGPAFGVTPRRSSAGSLKRLQAAGRSGGHTGAPGAAPP